MKKIVTALLLAAMLTLQAFLACAAGSIGYTVEKLDEGGNIRHKVTIRGNSNQNGISHVSLVIKQGEQIIMLEQEKTKEDGSFQFVFDMVLAGEFTASVNTYSGNELLSTTFKIMSKQEYQDIVDLFNKDDATALENAENIIRYQQELGIDITHFSQSEEFKTKLGARMLQYKGDYTLYNFNELFEKSIIFTYLYDTSDFAKIKEIMRYYDDYFELIDQKEPKNLYQSYLEFSESMQNEVLKALQEKHLKDFPKIKEAFYEAIVLNAFYGLNNTLTDAFLLKNMDYIKFTGYPDYSQVKRWEILTAMKKAEKAKTLEGLYGIYTTASVLPSPPPIPTKNPGGSSGTGGSGGGISYEKPTPAPTQTQKPVLEEKDIFTDLDSVPWAKEAILSLFQKGIVNGKEEKKFFPQDAITRGEFAKLIVCAFSFEDETSSSGFSDINGKWYESYALTAAKNGLISGFEDGTFRGDENISRQDMAVILYRSLTAKKLIGKVDSLKNPFSDFKEIAGYAQNAVLMLYNLNLLSGMEDGRFAPTEQATRAEVCTLLYKAMKGDLE